MQRASQKPALSEDMSTLLAQLAREDAGIPDPTTVPPDQAREIAELTNRRWNRNLPKMRQVNEIVFSEPHEDDIIARLFTPQNAGAGLIFFIHGGGFALCSIDTHERAARLLAQEANCAVLSIAYRLAPEHPYPAGLDDCISAFRQLSQIRNSYEWTKGPTAIAGDSAGANLALALILHEQEKGNTTPDFAMLFYGVYRSNLTSKSYIEHEHGPGLTRAKMARYFDWYVPENMCDNPLVAPFVASDEALRALPPLYLNAAEIDPLFSDTQDLAARLSALGRKDQVQIYNGVVHGFMQMTNCLPAACIATKEAGNAFRNFAGT